MDYDRLFGRVLVAATVILAGIAIIMLVPGGFFFS